MKNYVKLCESYAFETRFLDEHNAKTSFESSKWHM